MFNAYTTRGSLGTIYIAGVDLGSAKLKIVELARKIVSETINPVLDTKNTVG